MTASFAESTVVASPVGNLYLTSDGARLTGLYFESHKHGPESRTPATANPGVILRTATEQLSEYFAGTRRTFDVPVGFAGTEFQCKVWNALVQIEHGESTSYGELAERIGAPKAVRAVGSAVGRNPISIIVPCHRVVGSNGALTGFAGGLDRKRWLLDRERPGETGEGAWRFDRHNTSLACLD